ncbi:UDP-forming cellulose synthase catalytic subunit [uncultured Salipiger sp.]|uniref:UDP-forming cellulose synthase catalytic subunit n=1 Tax=uncultured Salipiger sp. TaxID=499810 RepID=UPI0025996174|nr:UDP-forming cellulose synthase catalytic subunit [uncultured Salipiger sp.]
MRRERKRLGAGMVLLILLWLALLAVIVVLAATPIATPVEALFALVGVSSIWLLKRFASTNRQARFIVLAIASVFVMRYWIWRLAETLPSQDDPLSFAAAVLLFGAETFTVALFFLTALVTADPIDRDPPQPMRPSQVPSVDILVPSYNEPPELLAVTLAAAKQVIYPEGRKTVVLCDDGGTDQRCNHPDPDISRGAQERRKLLQELCRDMDIVYSTRARNEHAKAGNLNAALQRLTGDLVLILDADHVPSRDILARTAGYFVENPRLFLVQTPHFFTNRDPIERNIGLPETCPSENEMFYSTIHRGLDRLGGAFFCGSAALLRRKALDEVGGISGVTITEDAETALDIHSRGWESMYVNRAMIAGLQPETFASFIQQRGRWATGMMQILILKNPLFRSGLSLAQRLCYLNSMSYWLFPVVRMTFLLSPLFYLFFGLQVFVVQPDEVMAYILPYLLVALLVQNGLFARVRWPLISEVYEIAQTPYLLMAVFKTMLRPHAAKFNVTAKDESLDNDFISPVMRPLFIITLIMFGGLVAAGIRWYMYPGDRLIVQIVGGWALFNFILTVLSLRSVFERQRRLRKPRTEIMVPAAVWSESKTAGAGVSAVLRMSSARTMQFTLSDDDEAREALGMVRSGDRLVLRPAIPAAPDLQHHLRLQVTRVSNDEQAGRGTTVTVEVEDGQLIPASEITAYLVYGNSEKWVAAREALPQARGLISGIVFVLRLSVRSIVPSVLTLVTHRAAPQHNRKDEDRNTIEKTAIEHYLADRGALPTPATQFFVSEETGGAP